MACTRFNARLGLCLLCLYFSVPLPHKFKNIDDSFKPNIEGTDTREKEANLYYTGLNIYLGSRMSHCNNSDEIITKSNIFRTEIARTEASSLNLPLQNTQLPNYFNRNEFQVQQKKNVFARMFPTQLLSKCEEETLAHLCCPQFCLANKLRGYHWESLLAGSFTCTFLLVYEVTAGSSVENKFTFGNVLFFFSQFNMHVSFCDSADKTSGKEYIYEVMFTFVWLNKLHKSPISLFLDLIVPFFPSCSFWSDLR